MVMLLPGDARGLDPYTASASNVADGSRLAALYDVLVWNDPATGTIRPQMAESLGPEADTADWVLTLRPGIKFTDGADLDAKAVERAWLKHQDPTLRSVGITALMGTKLTVEDKLRLRIKLPAPNANFDRMVARLLNFIPSPNTLEPATALETSKRAPVGAGPYKLREWVAGSHMTLDRNNGYWQAGAGKPYLDSVTFKVNPDTSAGAKLIDSGQADVTVSTDMLLIHDARERGLAVGEIPLNGGLMIVFNMRNTQPFANPALRRAVVLSLSSVDIDNRFYNGIGAPAKGIFDSSSPLANVQLASPENEPEEAAALFAGVTDNGRKPLNLTYVVPRSPKAEIVANYIKARVEEVSKGAVRMNVTVEDIPNFIKRTSLDAAFDAAVFQLWADDPEPSLYQFLRSDAQFSNVMGYKNALVDAALTEARGTSDQERRSTAYTQVQLQLNNDLPFFVYQEAVAAYVSDPQVTGLQLFNDGVLLFDRIGIRK